MANKTTIEWTDATWNPVTGCSKVSIGCKFCYAERAAIRLQAIGQPNYRNGFDVTLQEKAIEIPLKWKKPQMIFVNSMSDLFHENVPVEFILRVFDVMNKANWHRYQILTKRPERLLELNHALAWSPHIWMGVSVENKDYKYRIDCLRKTGAHIKFLSLEPLLGSMTPMNLNKIDWVIVGGESGHGARQMDSSWVREIRDECLKKGVPFFFKQWGGVQKKRYGRELDGKIWVEMPNKEKGRQYEKRN